VAKTALVLTETASGRAREIARQVKHVSGIKAVHMINESYGIIALVEAENSDGIRDIVASELASRPGVVRCIVCSERELPSSAETTGFGGIKVEDYCWCAREPVL